MVGSREGGRETPHASRPSALAAAFSVLLFSGIPATAASRVALIGALVDDSAANNDGSLEPGETVSLRVELFNDGDVPASAVTGVLSYLGFASDVTILNSAASWPDLPARGAPAFSSGPHFQVKLGAALPCGAVLPFRVQVSSGSGGPFLLDFSLKAGQRLDYDMKRDSLRRFNAPEAVFRGAAPFDNVGGSVAWGDVNGDGFADLILGAPLSDSIGGARLDAGAVYVVYGRATQWSDADLSAPPADAVRFWGAFAGDNLGAAVASGDFNGDGFDDVAIGAPESDSSGRARAGAGETYVIYGKAAHFTDIDLLTASSGVAHFFGADPVDAAGSSLASGDVNHDGRDDLLIGAPDADSVGHARGGAGEVILVYGQAASWGDTDLSSLPAGAIRLSGAAPGDGLGTSVGAGDVNGDGFADLIAGAPGSAPIPATREEAGTTFLVFGQGASLSDLDLSTAASGIVRIQGAERGDELGTSVAAGDVNGDGFADLIMGAAGSSTMGGPRPFGGEAWLLYGKAGPLADVDLAAPPSAAVRVDGADPFDSLGSSVAAGDVNGDGYDDLILGAPGAYSTGNARGGAGEVAVIYGRSSSLTDIDLASPPSGVARFFGGDDGEALGGSVASGDVNGDGYRDLILGARAAGPVADALAQAGLVDLWYGKPGDTYIARSDAFSFIDASAGTELALSCDDCSTPLSIGFNFPFYGELFSTVYVGSNGLLSFAPIDDPASAFPVCMPSPAPTRLLVAPFWDDLNPASGEAGSGIYALVQGTAPNRRMTIEWKDVPHKPAIGAVTFEATLFESTGQILFQYQDTVFGSGSFDDGAAAVIGVENRSGAHGVARSCFVGGNVESGAALRLSPATPVVESRSESGAGLWSASGLWHLSGAACEANQHTGTTGWYYGGDATCDYADPNLPSNSGSLDLPEITGLPADARIAYWSRRQTDGRAGFDTSKVQISTTGAAGPYTDLQTLADSSNVWKYSGVTNLFASGGATADLRFRFDTVDTLSNNHLGWMVDDVQVTGCNATGAGSSSARAQAFAGSSSICATGGGFVDAVGSFCGDSGVPSSYQWKENGADVSGATSVAYAIPPGKPVGTYNYSVAITCPGGAADLSAPAAVGVVTGTPGAVGSTLTLDDTPGFTTLGFHWSDIAQATDYVVFESATKNGAFTTITGTSPGGASGLTVPMPAGSIVYYLVAARGPCGVGPKK